MCSREKCCCLKLETGTLIFGIIACVLHGFLIIIFTCAMIDFNTMLTQNTQPSNFVILENGSIIVNNGFDRGPVYTNFVLFTWLLRSVMDFMFTALLCNGVIKRNPSQIKGFLNYGILMTGITFMITVRMLLTGGDLIVAFAILGVLVIYSLILHMVNLTHLKISSVSNGSEHKRLAVTMP